MAERFPAVVDAALRSAGWQPGRSVADATTEAVRQVCAQPGRDGHAHRAFPAAMTVLDEFGGLTVDPDTAGEDYLPRPFAIDPTLVAASVETLADFGAVLGTALFPLGMEGDREALLAIDEEGRVFSLDHAGEWLLGENFDAALETLVVGREPVRVRDDGGTTG